MKTYTQAFSTLAVGLLVTGLAACSVDADPTASDDGNAPESSAPDGDNAESPGWESETDPALRTQGCLVGRWMLDNNSWESELTRMFHEEAPGASATLSGEFTMDWSADGGYVMTAGPHSYLVRMSGNGGDVEIGVSHEGTESGSWTAIDSEQFAMTASNEDRLSAEVTATINGEPFDLNDSDLPPNPWTGTLLMACEATALSTTVTEDGRTVVVDWSRVS